MVNFNIKSPQDQIGVVKASVHRNGKLGFSSGAAKKLNLTPETRFLVATNADDPDDKNLYLIEDKQGNEKGFKVSRAGQYYYMRIKHVLDEMGIEYRNGGLIYDIVKVDEQERTYLKLIRRKPISRNTE